MLWQKFTGPEFYLGNILHTFRKYLLIQSPEEGHNMGIKIY